MSILQDILKKLWNHNHQPENYNVKDYAPKKRGDENWGGARTTRELEAIYTLANICLLRVDEVLKIEVHHIKLEGTMLTLTLPFRKTHQYGGKLINKHRKLEFNVHESSGIKPFFIHLMPEHNAHLCAVRAVAEWLRVSQITRGHLFRRMASGDRIGEKDVPMVCFCQQWIWKCYYS